MCTILVRLNWYWHAAWLAGAVGLAPLKIMFYSV